MNSSSTVQARTTEAAPGGRSRQSRATAMSMAAIPPLMSHEPRPYSRPPSIRGLERIDRHPVGRHRVLMDVEEKRPPRPGRLEPGQQVVPPGQTGWRLAGDARAARTSPPDSALKPRLEDLGTGQRAAHGVDARDRHQVAQEANHVVHG